MNTLIQYLMAILEFLEESHVVAICQPGPAVLATLAVMSERGRPGLPESCSLVASPVDVTAAPGPLNKVAGSKSLDWFTRKCTYRVPGKYAGAGRRVYPGFLQLAGFIGLDPGRHVAAHRRNFWNICSGRAEEKEKHRAFYDEYFSVMDMPAEFYLQTIESVFQKQEIAHGLFQHEGEVVDLAAITDVALLTVEGENDAICPPGQTRAAHTLCPNIPAARRGQYLQLGVGHYGVFEGAKFREGIAPTIKKFIEKVS